MVILRSYSRASLCLVFHYYESTHSSLDIIHLAIEDLKTIVS